VVLIKLHHDFNLIVSFTPKISLRKSIMPLAFFARQVTPPNVKTVRGAKAVARGASHSYCLDAFCIQYYFFLWRNSPTRARAASSWMILDNIRWHMWNSDRPATGTSSWQLTTLTRDRHSSRGRIRTRSPSKRAATGICVSPPPPRANMMMGLSYSLYLRITSISHFGMYPSPLVSIVRKFASLL
jgi:hypothetical protein